MHASIDGTVNGASAQGVVWIEKSREYKMATPKSIGALELSSIGMGFLVEDEMLKAASVELLIARTICSGKYLIVIGGIGQRRAGLDRRRA